MNNSRLNTNADTSQMMSQYLLEKAERCFAQWRIRFQSLQNTQQIHNYQVLLQQELIKSIGAFPERTPLNSIITGTIERKGFKVEKILFESQPYFYVSAVLFLPDSKNFRPPYPTVLVPCGHAVNGKAEPRYQKACALLSLNGIAAMIFDPVDQGERLQFLDNDRTAPISCIESHFMAGMGAILLGQNIARTMIWDAMRCLDYLQTRTDINSNKFGVMGNSGGGTLSSYLVCLDERIKAASPSCYITNFDKLLTTIGPQDAEQNLFGQIQKGIMHADYLIIRAPVPILICATTKDFFDINGTWDTFRYVKKLYTLLGHPEHIAIVEDNTKHCYSQRLREASVQWMLRWLCGRDVNISEPAIDILSKEEIMCTSKGQVMQLENAVSIYDLNRKHVKQLALRRQKITREKIRDLAGITKIADLSMPVISVIEQGQPERFVIATEHGICLPASKYIPSKVSAKKALIYLNENGKSCYESKQMIQSYLENGFAVLAIDLRGIGETMQNKQKVPIPFFGPDREDFYLAYLLGKSYIGMRTNDILSCVKLLKNEFTKIHLHAVGSQVGIPALHATACEPDLFEEVIIAKTLKSWSCIIEAGLLECRFTNILHNALTYYDLPDLMTIAGLNLIIQTPIDFTKTDSIFKS
ncbi:MAG: hypothetical protein WC496_09670 [Phycisphaerae bacterium]|jgi:hypothetical protein